MKNLRSILMMAVMACVFTLPLMGQGEVPESAPSVLGFITSGVLGMLVYFGGRVVKVFATGEFDLKYWFKDNGLSVGISLVGIIVISILNNSNPEMLNSLLSLIGVTVDVNTGMIGTLAFGTFWSGAVNEFVKQLTKETVVTTDGEGNKVS